MFELHTRKLKFIQTLQVFVAEIIKLMLLQKSIAYIQDYGKNRLFRAMALNDAILSDMESDFLSVLVPSGVFQA